MSAPPNILVLALLKEHHLYDLFSQLLECVKSAATLHFVDSKAALKTALKTKKPSAVLAIDGAISKEGNADVLQQLIQYTREGGIVVCCCNFSNGVNYLAAAQFFAQWSLPWDAGSYFRTAVHLNSSVAAISLQDLSPSYSIKSLSLVHVQPLHAVYNPSSSSVIQSHVFTPDRLPVDPAESPCAYAPVGRGYFGYVGDVNNEEDSTRVVLAMIRLPPSAFPRRTPEPQGSSRAGPQPKNHSDPNQLTMFSDAIRRAGHTQMIAGAKNGRTGEVFETIVGGASGPSNPPPAPIPTQRPAPATPAAPVNKKAPRSREREVEARAIKRAAVSNKKKTEAEQLKEQGNALFRGGDSRGAVSFYKRAIALRGPQPTYQANLAAAYMKLEMYKEAEEACEEALKHEPKHLKARFRRGSARLNMLCFKDAIEDFEACAKLAPTDPQFPAAIVDARRECARLKATGYEDQWADSDGQDLDSDEDEESEDDDFDFFEPPLDGRPLEIVSDSDSSDFEHEGNGKPCRFYNHDGCAKGSQCRFKHAPTKDKSTRDQLGRNVCNYWLLDGCRFGDRCVYTHSKEYLPENGWWTPSKDMDMMKDIMKELNHIRRPS
ncbi:hypothetical protein B0H11DRAFT_1852989 [Mycena galericulata]|nr:hypothetical protein B0H11DRAFT_1852989 [Mycena galericulata]